MIGEDFYLQFAVYFYPILSSRVETCMYGYFDFEWATLFTLVKWFFSWYYRVRVGPLGLSNSIHRRSVFHLHFDQAGIDDFDISIAEVSPEYDWCC